MKTTKRIDFMNLSIVVALIIATLLLSVRVWQLPRSEQARCEVCARCTTADAALNETYRVVPVPNTTTFTFRSVPLKVGDEVQIMGTIQGGGAEVVQ